MRTERAPERRPRKRKYRYSVVSLQRMRAAILVAFGVLAALTITAVLAVPHLTNLGVPAAAEPEATPTPAVTATPVPTATAAAAVSEPKASAPEVSQTPEPVAFTLDMLDESYVQLDDWRLVLVNGNVPLPEDFVMTPTLYSGVEVNSKIYTMLSNLIDGASHAGLSLWVASAYRSVETQEGVLENAVSNRMRDYGLTREAALENALLTIQRPGYSEHHTGMAVDFNYVSRDFASTAEYAWLSENAASYGFVERYPADKAEITGIDYEAWHYRYVGVDHAEAMQALDMCLEEYVVYLKNQGEA